GALTRRGWTRKVTGLLSVEGGKSGPACGALVGAPRRWFGRKRRNRARPSATPLALCCSATRRHPNKNFAGPGTFARKASLTGVRGFQILPRVPWVAGRRARRRVIPGRR